MCLNGGSGSGGAAGGVLVRHEGLSLVPLDEAAVDPAAPLQVLAALLPTSDLDSGSEDCSDSKGSSGDGSGGEGDA